MSSTASPRTWLPAALAALVSASVPRRRAEPEQDSQLFDPPRDDDAFDWLGFTAERD